MSALQPWSLPKQSMIHFPGSPGPGPGVILHSLYRLGAGESWQDSELVLLPPAALGETQGDSVRCMELS